MNSRVVNSRVHDVVTLVGEYLATTFKECEESSSLNH